MNGRCLKRVSLLLTLFLALILVAAAQKPTGPECKDDKSCSSGQYCQKTSGNCGGAGHCVAKPTICFFLFDPVCGCDGMTYGNSCFAAMAGTSVSHAGPCKSNCATNAQCKTAGEETARYFPPAPIWTVWLRVRRSYSGAEAGMVWRTFSASPSHTW